MRKLITLLVMLCCTAPVLHAFDGNHQHRMSREEFRAKQQTYITEKAELTKEEADKFFPVYFELQDQKKVLNDKAWELMRKGKQKETTEAQYNEILEGVYDARIASERLEQAYFEKFKKILPCRKIYKVLRAEMRFHRDLLKGMHEKGKGNHPQK